MNMWTDGFVQMTETWLSEEGKSLTDLCCMILFESYNILFLKNSSGKTWDV